MLLRLPKFDYVSCKTVQEACSFLSEHKSQARVLAGGTDLLVKMKHKKVLPGFLIGIKKIPDLDLIRYDDATGVRIGALTTIQTLKNSPLIMKNFSVLSQAAKVLGTAQVRNLATLGGNLCNASPASECAVPLLTLGACAKIAGPGKERVVPLENFFLGPGRTVLRNNELLTEIVVPNPAPFSEGVHLKYSTRRVDVAIVNVSVMMRLDGSTCRDVKIALGAVGPTPFRAKKAENILKEHSFDGASEHVIAAAARSAANESFPIGDIRAPADYRKKLIERLVKQGIERVIAQSGS